MNRLGIISALLLLVAGCASLTANRDTDERAINHMRVADSLEQAANLPGAAFEYGLVIQHYRTSTSYPAALRKCYLLYLNPDNSARNDSLAARWLSEYLALPLDWQERESARASLALLERIEQLRARIARKDAVIDSLMGISRKQGVSTASLNQRILELESQAKTQTEELKKLKDVDVRISKSRLKRRE